MYWYEYCPKHVESKYQLLVFKDNKPFLPLTDYYQDCLGRIDKSSATSYLKCLLPFFKWLEEESNYQGNRVQWNESEGKIRVAVEDYLQHKMSCKVRDKDSFRFVNLTNKSPTTISRFLSALKSFYKSMIRLKYYPHHNPLIDGQAILHSYKEEVRGVREDKPRMPSVAGTEDPATHRRLTDSYFKIINEEWQPQIIDDMNLPYQVYQAGKRVNWSQREMIIARMLFETGARASEIIELTVGDYRQRKNHQEVSTFNKGSHGRKIKFLRFSKDTVKRLFNYIDTERKSYDENHLEFDQLPDDAPIFLSANGTAFTYHAWYYHWKRAMIVNELSLNPHKARHWFVTSRLREIYNVSKSEAEIQQRKNELIKYMKWKNPDTMNVYEHHFDEAKHREAHEHMLEQMAQGEQEYTKQRKSSRKPRLAVIETTNIELIDEDLQELLEGLE
ncbi:tyrosine-type recombinase/integrase [Sporosarcina limicola]|uniref:Integrase n=1 Tax=Sporosarcina limicola TaxID=34101 RepID=A0A927R7B2_9BACL|nr:site-specific integrase [Sporosarcina limicola]MBE1555809.1 integrase [Sporosarcina limicola]